MLVCRPSIDHFTVQPENLFFVGDRAMRRYYVVFDRDNHRLGFAKSANYNKI